MAKQTFTTGQVLTAAQMTSLQQTAMLGGDASVKVASYTLVAADAGTTVAMNSASTTTITVNTGLFAAGDTVFIQNRGAGVCTVTAGSATIASAGSLALPQNDAGILYFTSTSAATFYDFIQVGATSPLTTKGDLYGYSTSDARIPIGANGTVLTADSTESLGLKWAAAAAGSGLTVVKAKTSFSNVANTGSTFDSVFSATYDNYLIIIDRVSAATSSDDLLFTYLYSGTEQATGYYGNMLRLRYDLSSAPSASDVFHRNNATSFMINDNTGDNTYDTRASINVYMGHAIAMSGHCAAGGSNLGYSTFGGFNETLRTYTGFRLKSSSSNITGSCTVYGLAKS